jgi:predicted DNA-binding transcriptional regulator AlpA
MSTGLSRHERQAAAAAVGKAALLVHNLNEAAAIMGVTRRTLDRIRARGEGPKIIQLSPRRVGITDADLRQWMAKLPAAVSAVNKPKFANGPETA